jgi:hypothetical protein
MGQLPARLVPALWKWLAGEIKAQRLQMSQVALDEVHHVAPDCHAWLISVGISAHAVTSAIAHSANAIKNLIGVQGDDFHPKGVDENDLIIIAAARSLGCGLVSNELQPSAPTDMKKAKIPTVCNLPQVSVQCRSFVEYLKLSKVVFSH